MKYRNICQRINSRFVELAGVRFYMDMDYKIREIRKNEHPILSEFLYEAIFIPEGMDKPPKSIIEQPELQVYIEDFGKAGFEIIDENEEEYIMVCRL